MNTEDIDKTKQSIIDLFEVIPDVKEAKTSGGKITLMEGGIIVIKHGGKAVRFISNLPEIGKELMNVNTGETTELFDEVAGHFGGSDKIKLALRKFVIAASEMNQSIHEFIAATKE